MRVEPTDVDPRRLLALLRDRYGRDGARLTFVPKGLDSWAWVAESGAERVLVKLYPPPRANPRGRELPLMAALADLGRVRVPRPVADREGRLVNAVGRYPLAVLEFLDGQTLEDETAWPEPLYDKVAATAAAIHASTDEVRDLVASSERFELPFLAPLLAVVDRLESPPSGPEDGDPTTTGLRDLIAPRATELRARIERLGALRDAAQRRHAEPVLCHTDLWGSNLLLDAAGDLHVLDWDHASLAPPEYDLFMFAGTDFFPATRFAWFLDRYAAAGGPSRPDATAIEFYSMRRNLEDLAEFAVQIVERRGEDEELRDALRFARGVVGDWPALDRRVIAATEVLAART